MMAILQLPSDSLRTKAENSLNIDILFRKHLSGEEIAREWIVYSPSTGSIFWFICVLFGDKHITNKFSGTGFIDHLNSAAHHSPSVRKNRL